MRHFWIDYTMPGDTIVSSVPVAVGDDGVFCDGAYALFCDGAYDVFNHYYSEEESAAKGDDYENIKYSTWEAEVCRVAPLIEKHGQQVSIEVNGDIWILTANFHRDHHGNEN